MDIFDTRRAFLKALPALPVIATIPLPDWGQPTPIELIVGHLMTPAGPVTSITRRWRPEDHGRCRLCPAGECRLSGSGMCSVMVNAYVAPSAAALFERPGPSIREGGAR